MELLATLNRIGKPVNTAQAIWAGTYWNPPTGNVCYYYFSVESAEPDRVLFYYFVRAHSGQSARIIKNKRQRHNY